MMLVPDPWYRERNKTDPWNDVQPVQLGSGSSSLLEMTEKEKKRARKRKRKHPIGFTS